MISITVIILASHAFECVDAISWLVNAIAMNGNKTVLDDYPGGS